MGATSAGLVMYRVCAGTLEVLIVHPGGPLWTNKHDGAWTIPKGTVNEGEELLDAACREFREETGIEPSGPYTPLSSVRLKSGKRIHAWAFRGECDPAAVRSNTFEMEWPRRSGKMRSFPEVDEARFCTRDEAARLLNPAQVSLIDELAALLVNDATSSPRPPRHPPRA